MKLKSFILTIGLSLFALSGLFAQDKYEYAVLRGYIGGCYASLANVTFTVANEQQVFPSKPTECEKDLIKKLNELSGQGWEVYNSSSSGEGTCILTIYFLRKKKN